MKPSPSTVGFSSLRSFLALESHLISNKTFLLKSSFFKVAYVILLSGQRKVNWSSLMYLFLIVFKCMPFWLTPYYT